MDDTKYTLSEHLSELRGRLIKSALAVLVTTSICLTFSTELLEYAIRPLQRVLKAKNKVNTVVLDPRPDRAAPLVARLEDDERVRFIASVPGFAELEKAAREAITDKKPLDLVLVATEARTASDAASLAALDAIGNLDPPPHLAYLVDGKHDPAAWELMLDGVSVMPATPSPARLARELRRAAAEAGKTSREDRLVVLSPLDPFFAYLKVALVCGLFLACPIWLFQGWRFIAPGLYESEKSIAGTVVVSGSLLFLAGGAFAYFVMFPLMFDVLVNQMMPQDLSGSFTVDNYLMMLFGMTLAFGVIFELPLVIAMLARLGIVTPEFLTKYRRYWIVASFVIGAVLTPADPISQSLMALPLIVFYEIGIVLARIMRRRRDEQVEANAEAAAALE